MKIGRDRDECWTHSFRESCMLRNVGIASPLGAVRSDAPDEGEANAHSALTERGARRHHHFHPATPTHRQRRTLDRGAAAWQAS